MKPEKILPFLHTYGIITLGLFINALGWTAFLLPSGIIGGGISGVGALVFFATGLPMGYTVFAVNIILVTIGMKKLGGNFGIKTIYSVTVLSFFLALLQNVITGPVVDDRFMSAIIGGILGGVSVGLVFNRGGSMGGTEIIALLVNKYRKMSPGKVMLFCDVVIITSSYFIFQSIETIVYGYVTMGVVSYVVDLLLNGARASVQMFIFSNKNQELANKIALEVKRGVTFIKGKGWYTNQDKDILMIVVRKYESRNIFRLIMEIDPEAFVTQASVMGVYGKGFDTFKYRPRRRGKRERVEG